MAYRNRHTKIVATLGPACADEATQRKLVEAGADVARLNASHGDKEFFGQMVRQFRAVAASLDREVSVLLDLRGPKIRVGRLATHTVELLEGASLRISTEDFEGTAERIPCTYAGLPGDVEEGDRILLDDGLLELKVTWVESETEIECEVIFGGVLKPNKGINVPGRPLSTSAFDAKDLRDLQTGIELEVDWIALSFVRSADDVTMLREAMHQRGGDIPIIAKIEKPQALEHLDEILQVSDGIMVARGDLGVEVPAQRVPGIQKSLIQAADDYGIPVITATQMLESMMEHPRPTRAEASDVANAIFDGSDAVMLSGETAAGKYPLEAVTMMNDIAEASEQSRFYRKEGDLPLRRHDALLAATTKAARVVARTTESPVIVTYTRSGRTALVLSKLAPSRPIVGMSPNPEVVRRMALYHGVIPIRNDFFDNTDQMLLEGDRRLVELGLVKPGQTIVVLGGSRQFPGVTNMMQIRRIPE